MTSKGGGKMELGKAVAIIKNIDSEEYTTREKGTAILTVMEMETKNSITKDDMQKVIMWLLDMAFEIV